MHFADDIFLNPSMILRSPTTKIDHDSFLLVHGAFFVVAVYTTGLVV